MNKEEALAHLKPYHTAEEVALSELFAARERANEAMGEHFEAEIRWRKVMDELVAEIKKVTDSHE